eukprot:Nk52_evm21s356 gene=Nk52_evmTU21s356
MGSVLFILDMPCELVLYETESMGHGLNMVEEEKKSSRNYKGGAEGEGGDHWMKEQHQHQHPAEGAGKEKDLNKSSHKAQKSAEEGRKMEVKPRKNPELRPGSMLLNRGETDSPHLSSSHVNVNIKKDADESENENSSQKGSVVTSPEQPASGKGSAAARLRGEGTGASTGQSLKQMFDSPVAGGKKEQNRLSPGDRSVGASLERLFIEPQQEEEAKIGGSADVTDGSNDTTSTKLKKTAFKGSVSIPLMDNSQPKRARAASTSSNSAEPTKPPSPHVLEGEEESIINLLDEFEKLLMVMKVNNATWYPNLLGDEVQVQFSIHDLRRSEDIVRKLVEFGLGVHFGSINVVPLHLTRSSYIPPSYNPNETTQSQGTVDNNGEMKKLSAVSKFVESIRSRALVEQVAEATLSQAILTFDYVALTFSASLLAGIGLITDNVVVVVASMLVSPLMGPIMAFTFGSIIHDWPMVKAGLISEAIGLTCCVITGILLGLVGGYWGDYLNWPTEQMSSRGTVDSIYAGIAVAIPSGLGVALGVLGNNTGSLVGVAISASLLPPAVNAGINWAYAVVGPAWSSYTVNQSHFAEIGALSFALTAVNIVCIYFSALAMFKLKEVAPIPGKSKFWATDVGAAREFNEETLDQEKREEYENIMRNLASVNAQTVYGDAMGSNFSLNSILNADTSKAHQTVGTAYPAVDTIFGRPRSNTVVHNGFSDNITFGPMGSGRRKTKIGSHLTSIGTDDLVASLYNQQTVGRFQTRMPEENDMTFISRRLTRVAEDGCGSNQVTFHPETQDTYYKSGRVRRRPTVVNYNPGNTLRGLNDVSSSNNNSSKGGKHGRTSLADIFLPPS